MKIKGAELQLFINEGWPGAGTPEEANWYWDHDVFDEDPDPGETYDTDDLGPIRWQGLSSEDQKDIALDKAIRAWRKARKFDSLIVDVPKDQRAAFDAFLKEIGGKILKS